MNGASERSSRPALRALAVELELGTACADRAGVELPAFARRAECPAALRHAAHLRALGRAACDAGDHAGEARVARRRLADTEEGEVAERLAAWQASLEALGHQADRAGSEPALAELREVALLALGDVGDRLAAQGVDAGPARAILDPIAAILGRAEAALGLPLSPQPADLERRRRARQAVSAAPVTFADRQRDGLVALWRRDAPEYLAGRHLDRHGVPPPAGWWVEDPASDLGGDVAAGFEHLFDAADRAAFFEEMESRYRAEQGLPARGEGRVSEASLARAVEASLPGSVVVREARAGWLGAQRLDIYLPELELAIEYQGEQHYLPLAVWGGEAGLLARRELDERKRDACLRAGIRLVEWRYDEPISVARVRARLAAAGIHPPDAPDDPAPRGVPPGQPA